MERILRQTQEQLLQSEKLAAMGRLTSQIAHELNNPLYGIMNTLELMKTEISPENKRRKVLDMALSETVRLGELLRKMLSFSKPGEEERQPTDINGILDEILLLHEKQLREKYKWCCPLLQRTSKRAQALPQPGTAHRHRGLVRYRLWDRTAALGLATDDGPGRTGPGEIARRTDHGQAPGRTIPTYASLPGLRCLAGSYRAIAVG